MLGVGLHKLCPLDSFGDAFREKKSVRKSTPRRVQNRPAGGPGRPPGGSFVPVGPNLAAKAVRKPCLGALGALLGRLWRSWNRLGGLLGRPGPLQGASWGSFRNPPRADLDDLDEVYGAT